MHVLKRNGVINTCQFFRTNLLTNQKIKKKKEKKKEFNTDRWRKEGNATFLSMKGQPTVKPTEGCEVDKSQFILKANGQREVTNGKRE